MFPFSFRTSTAEFESRFEIAEEKLLEIAKRRSTRPTHSWDVTTLDTHIPRAAVPCLRPATTDEEKTLKIHSVKVVSKEPIRDVPKNDTAQIPLVLLHGYMNCGQYFYRNFAGLSRHFRTIYSVDLLGWGLSSRPPFEQVMESDTIKSAEDFFVESLEAWRKMNNIDKMILSGHSFGGYVAVAYSERYPEHVDRLILLSPFGVQDEEDPNFQRKMARVRSSLLGQCLIRFFQFMFDTTTPGSVIRSFTEHLGSMMARNYVERRLPQISDPEESEVLADLLYSNAALPPSSEFFLRTLFTNSMLAKRPILFRVPSLKVKSVNFMYGTKDWMDISGGMYTEALCHRLSLQQKESSSAFSSSSMPTVNVFLVPNAGHLLMLQNPQMVEAGIISIAGGKVLVEEMPTAMNLNETEELHQSWLYRAQEILAAEETTPLL